MTEATEGFWTGLSLITAVTVLSMAMLLVNISADVALADTQAQVQSDNIKEYNQIFQYDNTELRQLDLVSLILRCKDTHMYVQVFNGADNLFLDTRQKSYEQEYLLTNLDANSKYKCTVITDTGTPNYSSVLGFKAVKKV